METEKLLNEIVTLLVIPILPAVSAFVITWFKAKTEEIKSNIENQTVKQYIDILNCAVTDVVKTLNQTTVQSLKEASADGKLTKGDADKIKKDAIESTYKILGEKGKVILQNVFTDLDAVIEHKIEATVNTLNPTKQSASKK